jgi:hypothetical protein
MNAYELISAHLKFQGVADPTDGNSTSLRATALDRLQEATEEFWQYMDGADFQQAMTTVSLTSGAFSVDCPATFFKLGETGRLILRYTADDRRTLTPLTPHEVFEMQETNGSTTGIPRYYCIGLQDASSYYPEIHFDVKAESTMTFALYYVKTPPTLTDANTATSGLQYIPQEYHKSVLFKGLLAKAARDSGDARAPMFNQEFMQAMANAKAARIHGQEDAERIGRSSYASFEMW